MKKVLLLIAACVFSLLSVTARADAIFAPDASGITGSTVSLNVSLLSGDISFGGDFTIGYDTAKLTLLDVLAGDPMFSPLRSFTPGSESVSLVNSSGSSYGSGPLFSVLFRILATFPDSTPVDISGVLYDAAGSTNALTTISPLVTVDQRTGTLPEPGVFGLAGAALLAMAARRMRRG